MAVRNAVVVTAPGCHLCEDAEAALAAIDGDALATRTVDAGSLEGRWLVARHRPALLPLVVIDGEPFSAGRLPRGKLRRLLAIRWTP